MTGIETQDAVETQDAIVLEGVSLHVESEGREIQLLDAVDLRVARGQAVAIVGESGSGKSMTLRTISRLLPPGARTEGAVSVLGQRMDQLGAKGLRAVRRDTIGTIFQDPRSAINPLQRIEHFMLEAVRDAGGDLAAARSRSVELLERMGIPDVERRLRQYPYELSGGLLQRVLIASVLLARPDVILADEPTTALDVTTQSDVLAITEELCREQGTAMVFVTHDLDLAMAMCDRVYVLYAGRVVETGDADDIRSSPRHPYTVGLLASRPPLDHRLDLLPVIDGSPVAAWQVEQGCPFVDRCPVSLDVCHTDMPAPSMRGTSMVRCHRADEVTADQIVHDLEQGGRHV